MIGKAYEFEDVMEEDKMVRKYTPKKSADKFTQSYLSKLVKGVSKNVQKHSNNFDKKLKKGVSETLTQEKYPSEFFLEVKDEAAEKYINESLDTYTTRLHKKTSSLKDIYEGGMSSIDYPNIYKWIARSDVKKIENEIKWLDELRVKKKEVDELRIKKKEVVVKPAAWYGRVMIR